MSEAQQKSVIELPATSFTRNEERGGAVVANPANPMTMLAVAVQRGMDASTIKDLMDLNERWERGEARKAFNKALAAFKAEAVEVIKNKRVHFTNQAGKVTDYKHAELSDVIEAVAPALSKHGFSWGWKTKQEGKSIEVTCELRHELGYSESVSLTAPADESGGKNSVQQIVSTVTYLERHTLKAICGIAEKGQDDDGRSAKGMPDEELQEWVKKIEATTTKEKAKEVCAEGVKAANKYNDLSAYNALKGVHKSHTDFIEKAAK
jgi:hypothetical protein